MTIGNESTLPPTPMLGGAHELVHQMKVPWLSRAEIDARSSLRPALGQVLIVCPSYSGPELMTRGCLDLYRQLGADVIESMGCSDVSLHRNLILGQARRFLKTSKGKDKHVVLLLDSDMVASPQAIDVVCSLAAMSAQAVCAGYCKRGVPTELAYESRGDAYIIDGLDCLPVRGGLGCMAIPASKFAWLCDDATQARVDDNEPVPVLCTSGMYDGLWLSDDFSFCVKLEKYCGVYMAPIAIGHVSKLALQPAPFPLFVNRDE